MPCVGSYTPDAPAPRRPTRGRNGCPTGCRDGGTFRERPSASPTTLDKPFSARSPLRWSLSTKGPPPQEVVVVPAVRRIAVALATTLSVSVGMLLTSAPAQAACQSYSGFVCIYRDHGGSGPQYNTKGNLSNYTAEWYPGTTATLNDTASRYENRSANGNNRVRIYYHVGYSGYFGCVNPGSTWDLPGGGWGDYPGDGRNPDDNASSHSWASGISSSCV